MIIDVINSYENIFIGNEVEDIIKIKNNFYYKKIDQAGLIYELFCEDINISKLYFDSCQDYKNAEISDFIFGIYMIVDCFSIDKRFILASKSKFFLLRMLIFEIVRNYNFILKKIAELHPTSEENIKSYGIYTKNEELLFSFKKNVYDPISINNIIIDNIIYKNNEMKILLEEVRNFTNDVLKYWKNGYKSNLQKTICQNYFDFENSIASIYNHPTELKCLWKKEKSYIINLFLDSMSNYWIFRNNATINKEEIEYDFFIDLFIQFILYSKKNIEIVLKQSNSDQVEKLKLVLKKSRMTSMSIRKLIMTI